MRVVLTLSQGRLRAVSAAPVVGYKRRLGFRKNVSVTAPPPFCSPRLFALFSCSAIHHIT